MNECGNEQGLGKNILTLKTIGRQHDHVPLSTMWPRVFRIFSLPILFVVFSIVVVLSINPYLVISNDSIFETYYEGVTILSMNFMQIHIVLILLTVISNVGKPMKNLIPPKYERVNRYADSSLFQFAAHLLLITFLITVVLHITKLLIGEDVLSNVVCNYNGCKITYTYAQSSLEEHCAKLYMIEELFVLKCTLAFEIIIFLLISEQLMIQWIKEYQKQMNFGEECLNQWLKKQGLKPTGYYKNQLPSRFDM